MSALELPDRLLITPEPATFASADAFLIRLAQALDGGVRLVQLRSRGLDGAQYALLAERARALCHNHDARLLLNPPPQAPWPMAADGIHLTSPRLMDADMRPSGYGMVSAACHDAAQLAQAQRLGVDFVTLSPVLATATHPEAAPIGWEKFEVLAKTVTLPVYALGGMTLSQLAQAREKGAQGIAAIRGLW
ncbi:Thiamine-phosphate synthase [Pandoraea terrae]|uniref:Thiamine-phosphate synthase n=1 Tax=Pandoraea terrae TaxID=1537710 RepID=A0A5E4Z990_9BURK|nr:thiamine phosphate synthase [Pandoraea terrae]VVE57358.1 Thiamine-phosphate synthase [Pandoraea terrae]